MVTSANVAMKILKSLSREGFREDFGTKEQCLSYLSSEKWGNNYQCIKCKNEKYSKGEKQVAREEEEEAV